MLRFLLRGWLQRTAQEKLREKVVEAARQQMGEGAEEVGGEGEGEDEALRQPCDVGVVFALIDGHQPSWIISAGLAGGLSPELARNDILMADAILDISGRRLAIDLRVDPESLRGTPGVHVGTLLSADRVVRSPEEKRELGREHGALAVDMETYVVADVCRRRGVRFLSVRVIGDPVDEELAPEVRGLLKQKSRTAQLGAVMGAIWKRPSSVKDMYCLRENALVASDRLGKFLSATIQQLVPLPPAER